MCVPDLEPLPLKQYCRLKILNHLERKKFSGVQQLPLPQHLKVKIVDMPRVGKDWSWGVPFLKRLNYNYNVFLRLLYYEGMLFKTVGL